MVYIERRVIQETRLFDVNRGVTKSMRGTEEASDYRYFPDPDLRAVVATEEMIEEAKDIPELSRTEDREVYNKLGIKRYVQRLNPLKKGWEFFEGYCRKCGDFPKFGHKKWGLTNLGLQWRGELKKRRRLLGGIIKSLVYI